MLSCNWWRSLSERQLNARDSIFLSVAVSLFFPVILIVLERLVLPVSIPEPNLRYEMDHRTTGFLSARHVYHEYTFRIENVGASLRDSAGAEFLLRFRKEIVGVRWVKPFTRGTFIEQCEFVDKKMSQYYIRFQQLSAESHVELVIRSKEELSHDPKLHYGNKEGKMTNCNSGTNEGKAYCRGDALRPALMYHGRYLHDICTQMTNMH